MRSLTALRTAGLPLCAPSLRFMVDGGATADRIGVTPSIFGRNRMWKYHSSFAMNGLTPRVIGCFGITVNFASQCGLTDQNRSKCPPIHSMNISLGRPLTVSTP